MGQPIVATIQLATADDNGIAAAQTLSGAANLNINGALVTGGVAVLTDAGAMRQVIITSSGDDTGVTFTIYGTDESGIAISEALTGADTAAATSAKYYRTVTRIAASGATDGNVIAGTNGVGVTRWINYNLHAQPFNVINAVDVTGTVNYTVQYTYDSLDGVDKIWNDPILASQTADGETTYSFPIAGSRILVNSGTGEVELTAIQAGIVGG